MAFLRALLRLPSGWIVSAVLVALLTYLLASSTVQANWVPGSTAIVLVALLAALLMGVLAVLRFLPWPLGLAVGALAAPLAAYVASLPALHAAHPGDPVLSPALVQIWIARVNDGTAGGDGSFFLYLMALLFWVVGGWMSWCVLRWRQPLLGLVPGAAAFATTLLNYPQDQNGFVLFFLVITLGLLLWNHFNRASDDLKARHVRRSSDSLWDFWETGVAVLAGVVIVAIFLPPLSTVDRTVDIENGMFRNWAELNQRLNHPVPFGHGTAIGTSTGFSDDVTADGPLHRGAGVVFTYTIEGGNYQGPRYFRGTDATITANGKWRYASDGSPVEAVIPANTVVPYAEEYRSQGIGVFDILMLKPPSGNQDIVFYPGEIYRIDRATAAHAYDTGNGQSTPGKLLTLDRLSGPPRQGGAGAYKATSTYSLATEDDLRAASASYPVWLDPYRNFGGLTRRPGSAAPPPTLATGAAYRSPEVLARIRQLALQITAGETNPYDQVQAIQNYLRANYTYTLTPPSPPRGADVIDTFLFLSREGYCEYFATAMGDLVRSLGIPVRLVNGYGPGTYDEHLQRYVVRESDAHTWVETYSPGFGWIPWEPTPDGVYYPITRGNPTGPACAPDSQFCDPGTAADQAGAGASNSRPDKPDVAPDVPGGGQGFVLPPLGRMLPVAGGLLLLLLALYLAIAQYLRPSSAGAAWDRIGLLARLAGLRRRAHETPLEFGRRLGAEAPELKVPALRLAEAYQAVAYAPNEIALRERRKVLEAYSDLRPLLIHRIRDRNRFA